MGKRGPTPRSLGEPTDEEEDDQKRNNASEEERKEERADFAYKRLLGSSVLRKPVAYSGLHDRGDGFINDFVLDSLARGDYLAKLPTLLPTFCPCPS